MAMAYHGHQFRTYNPDIGDGRGFLFAQLRGVDGRLYDLGTKGSGQTPFSRTGDGRLTLKGAVREILATELLEALGVRTSRTLSVIETGEALQRHDEPSPTRSAVLVRISESHIRFGSFQRLAFLGDEEGLRKLWSYVGKEHLAGSAHDDGAMFESIVRNMARMTAELMAAGFVHGVLNTDNMNVTGECFDYGPWRFLPTLKPGFTAAYFDHGGLYAFGRQPEAIYWNLAALADALRPILPTEALQNGIRVYPDAYASAFAAAIFARLGVTSPGGEEAQSFAEDFFSFLHETQLPFERAFFDLFGGRAGREKRANSPHKDVYAEADALMARLDAFVPLRPERLEHPAFGEGPQTLLIDEVEDLWAAIAERDDWSPLHDKIQAIRRYGEALGLSRPN
jgi:uncharacterized protein YdiU (UPF0061 family)